MEHVFIINPNSGKRTTQKLIEDIKTACEEASCSYDIYITREQGDGGRYAAKCCEEAKRSGDSLRIYACGGDGTINEIVNGCFGYDSVEIGAVPLGTGNDYIRNYGDAADFLDIRRQLSGVSKTNDLIKYKAVYGDSVTEGYCANMFNIGFDCNVVDMTDRVKTWPLISGSLAYLISVFIILIKKKGADLTIKYEDGRVINEKILLIAIANGCYCGGGVKGVPECELDDGLMDVSVIRDVTRRFFISLFPSYAKGTHLSKPAMIKRDVIRYTKEKKLTVTANAESLRLCTDGEITTQKRIEFSAVPDAFRFIVPAGYRELV